MNLKFSDEEGCSFMVTSTLSKDGPVSVGTATDPIRYQDRILSTRPQMKTMEIQCDPPTQKKAAEFDKARLLGFLRSRLPLIENAFKEQREIENTIGYWKAGISGINNTRLVQTLNLQLSDDLKLQGSFEVSCAIFNSSGMVLVLGLENTKLDTGSRMSKVMGFNLFKSRDQASKCVWKISTPASVTCMAFHPRKPTALAVGLENGVIELHETSRTDENSLIFRSESHPLFHSEPVTELRWCFYRVNNSPKILLASSSKDGKILLWEMGNKLRFPKRGYLVSTGKSKDGSKDILTSGIGMKWSQELIAFMSNIPEANKTEFSVIKLNAEQMARKEGIRMIELHDFLKFKIEPEKLYLNALRDQFTPHFKGVWKIEFNPMNKDIFFTASNDNFIKIMNYESHNTLVLLEVLNQTIADVAWLPENPNGIIVTTLSGKTLIYDLSKSIDEPEESFDLPIRETDSIVKLVCSEMQGMVIFLTKSGALFQFELSDNLKNPQFVLDKVYPS